MMMWPGTPTGPAAGADRSETRPARGSRDVRGMVLESRGDRVIVSSIRDGSSAAATGLKAGDVLLVINDVNLIDLDTASPRAVADLIEGHEDHNLRLIVGRRAATLGVMLAPSRPGTDSPMPPPIRRPEVGGPAPLFGATDLQGDEIILEELRGRPVLIDFWASWCPPCRDAVITLRRYSDQFGEALTIVGISLDEDPRAFEAFVYNLRLPGHQIHDGGPQGPITTLYDVAAVGIPYSVLIAPDGSIVKMAVSLQEQEESITRLLAGAADGERH